MRRATIYVNKVAAGVLEDTENGYRFTYDPGYLRDTNQPAISLTLPKQADPFDSPVLFPFFFGLLAEGNLKSEQCRRLQLDEDDHFGRLIKTAGEDTVGAVSVKES